MQLYLFVEEMDRACERSRSRAGEMSIKCCRKLDGWLHKEESEEFRRETMAGSVCVRRKIISSAHQKQI